MSDLNSLTLNAALNEAVEWLTAAEYAQAVARCEDLLSSYPDAARVLSVRARALHAMGETARAAQDYARVLEITPADEQSLFGLMRCQLRFGQKRQAALTARQLLDYDTGCVDAARLVREAGGDVSGAGRVLRVRQRFAAGFTNQAIADLRAMLDAAPDRADLQVILAEMLWRAGLRVTTVELCQTILDAQPDCLNANVILYALWSHMGSTSMSAVYLRAVTRLDPDFRETAAWLGDRSPIPVQDVPASIDLARRQAFGGAEDDERDRSEWVDLLISSDAPQTPIDTTPPDLVAAQAAASAGLAAGVVWPVPPDHPQNNLDVEEQTQLSPNNAQVIFPPSPLDSQPGGEDDAAAQADVAGSDAEEEVPAWLSGMRQQSQPLNESDWEAIVPAETGDLINHIVAQPAAEFAPIASPSARPAPAAEIAVNFAPLEWQPAEPEPPAEAASAATIGQSISQRNEWSAPVAQVAENDAPAQRADRPATRPPTRDRARPPKEKASAEHLLSLARRSLETADYGQAAHYYGQLVTAGKKLDDVLADLDAATHAYPDVPEFHSLLGRVYTRKGDVSAALAAYQQALKLKS